MATRFRSLGKIAARPHKTHVAQLSPHAHRRKGTHGDIRKAIAFGKKHGIVIVNDNPYSFILNDNPMSIMQVDGAKEIAIEMNSLSKSHNMPGWRVGMAASNQTFISWILKVKSNIDSGQFKPLMLAAAKALEADKSWHDEVNAVYASRRKVAEKSWMNSDAHSTQPRADCSCGVK